MTQQEAHEALVEKVADRLHKMWGDSDMTCARAALAVIAQELQVVTPEMRSAWSASKPTDENGIQSDFDWHAMLAASPLNPETKP